MTTGVILLMLQTYIQIRWKFYDVSTIRFVDPLPVQELRHEITIWERTAASMAAFSHDENVIQSLLQNKIKTLGDKLDNTIDEEPESEVLLEYKTTLQMLQKKVRVNFHYFLTNFNFLSFFFFFELQKYPIRDKLLLIKSMITLSIVVVLFFLHSVPNAQHLSIGWSAFIGVLLLLILSGRTEIDHCLAMVEWSTLLFFAALFVLMECLSEMGFILWMGNQTENVVTLVSEEHRLTAAVLLILWVSDN